MKYKDRGVIGIDFSGDPSVSSARYFDSAFSLARKNNLKLSIHFAESPNEEEDDDLYILNELKPDRIGHACFLSSAKVEQAFFRQQIPLEVCMTSNVKTLCKPSIEQHHVSELYLKDYPFVLCVSYAC